MIKIKEINWCLQEYDSFRENYCDFIIDKLEGISEEISTELGRILEISDNLSEKKIFEQWFFMPYEKLIKIKKDESIIIDDSKFNKFIPIYDDLIKKRFKDTDMTFNSYLIDQLGIVVCPYCNRNYVNNREKEDGKTKSSAQLDHFFNKASKNKSIKAYSVFSLCINNFIPSCAACNHIKSSESFEISPYSEEISNVEFKLDLCSKKLFTILSKNSDLNKQIKVLGINEFYSPHKSDVEDLIAKAQIYTDDKLKELSYVMDINNNSVSLKELVFGKEIEPEDYMKNSLSKFRRDVINQLLD